MRADSLVGRLVGALARDEEPWSARSEPAGGLRSDGPTGLLVGALARAGVASASHAMRDEPLQRKSTAQVRDRLPVRAQISFKLAEARWLVFSISRVESTLQGDFIRLSSLTSDTYQSLSAHERPFLKGNRFKIYDILHSAKVLARHAGYVERRLTALTDRAVPITEFLATLEAESEPSKVSAEILIDARDEALRIGHYTRDSILLVSSAYRVISGVNPELAVDLERSISRLTPIAIKLALTISRNDFSSSSLTGFDLRSFDLSRVKFTGAIWSDGTRWPVSLEEEIRRESREIAPEVYKVIGPAIPNILAGSASRQ
jgi:hypothetical protein